MSVSRSGGGLCRQIPAICAAALVATCMACRPEGEPIAALPPYHVNLHFGATVGQLQAARPSARNLEYAGWVEERAWPGVEEVGYSFRPAKPEWLEQRFGRLQAVTLYFDSAQAAPELMRQLVGLLGTPDTVRCERTTALGNRYEIVVSEWSPEASRHQVVSARFVTSGDSVGAPLDMGRVWVQIYANAHVRDRLNADDAKASCRWPEALNVALGRSG